MMSQGIVVAKKGLGKSHLSDIMSFDKDNLLGETDDLDPNGDPLRMLQYNGVFNTVNKIQPTTKTDLSMRRVVHQHPDGIKNC